MEKRQEQPFNTSEKSTEIILPKEGAVYDGIVFEPHGKNLFKSKIKLSGNSKSFLVSPGNWIPRPLVSYEISLTKQTIAPSGDGKYLGHWECSPVNKLRDERAHGNK